MARASWKHGEPIECDSCGDVATVRRESLWEAGNTKGVSFFYYYCDIHAPIDLDGVYALAAPGSPKLPS